MSKYFIPTGYVGLSYSPVIHIKNAYDRLEAESKANTKLTRERGLNVNMRFKYAAVYLNERMYDAIIKLEEHTKRTDTYDKRMARFITKSKAEMTYYQRMLGKTSVITPEEMSDFMDALTEQQGKNVDIFLCTIQQEWLNSGVTGDLNMTCSYLELINVISNIVGQIVTNYRNATKRAFGFHDNALDFLVTNKTRDLSWDLLNRLPGNIDKHTSNNSLMAFEIVMKHLYDDNRFQKALDAFNVTRNNNVHAGEFTASQG